MHTFIISCHVKATKAFCCRNIREKPAVLRCATISLSTIEEKKGKAFLNKYSSESTGLITNSPRNTNRQFLTENTFFFYNVTGLYIMLLVHIIRLIESRTTFFSVIIMLVVSIFSQNCFVCTRPMSMDTFLPPAFYQKMCNSVFYSVYAW